MSDSAASPGPSGYDPAHFDRLLRVEDRHFWFTSRNRLLARVLGAIRLGPGARILEIGTGTGNTLRVLEAAWPDARIVGVDLFAEGLACARQRTRLPLVRAAIERLPFTGPFDVIAAFDVLEHVADDAAALRQLRALLAPDGRLVMTVPAFDRLWSAFDVDAHHFRRYELGPLRAALTTAGYGVERATYFMATLYPLMRAARWTPGRGTRTRPTASAVARELRMVPGVNAVLRTVLSVEAEFVGRGGSLPFGTSVLALARRS